MHISLHSRNRDVLTALETAEYTVHFAIIRNNQALLVIIYGKLTVRNILTLPLTFLNISLIRISPAGFLILPMECAWIFCNVHS